MKFFISILILPLSINFFAQESDSTQRFVSSDSITIGKIKECNVFLKNSSELRDVRLVSIGDSTLTIDREGFEKVLMINDIQKIQFRNPAFLTGAGIGFLGSVAIWGIIGLASFGGDGHMSLPREAGFVIGLVLGIPTAVITGIIAGFATPDDEYYFYGNNIEAKKKRLRYIIKKQKE